METWKPVKNFDGLYEVSNRGNVRSLKCRRVRAMKKCRDPNNYERLCLVKNKMKFIIMKFLNAKKDLIYSNHLEL